MFLVYTTHGVKDSCENIVEKNNIRFDKISSLFIFHPPSRV